jgi:N-carbamoylputrescine amidase
MSTFTIGLIQMRCSPDPGENLDRAVTMLRQAAGQGVQIACLPELFRTPYFCQKEDPRCFDLAEPIPGPTSAALQAVARDTGMSIVGSVFERRMAGVYHNTAIVVDGDGALLGKYRKMHIPDDPLYYEKFYFTPGDLGFRTFATRHARVGTLVCWDQWFPEAARLTALQGAEVLFYPTAIGWHPREKAEFGAAQHNAWETMQRAHAIANGVYVAAVNRIGHEPALSPPSEGGDGGLVSPPSEGGDGGGGGLEFWGASFVCDPFGRVLARAAHDQETVLVVECDPRQLEEVRRNWPFFRDRRIDAYGPLTERTLNDAR